MKVKECTISELLKGKNSFLVPPFQRRYAWREQNFKMLWDDILAVADGARKRHFMGTVIFEPSGKDSSSLVIDGQQRLTTYIIILKVMHALASELNFEEIKLLEKYLILNMRSRLTPSLPDRSAMETLIDNPSLLKKGKEHRNVRACFEFYDKEIRNYVNTTKGTRPGNFKKILRILSNNMIFVELQLSASDDSHSIFETINYAGVPLTSADLARNFVLGLAKRGESPEELNRKYWQPLERRLEESICINNRRARKAELQRVLPELLRSFLIVEKRKYISASDTFREFRFFFKSGDLEAKLDDLSSYSEIFCRFLNPELERNRGVQAYLQNFVDLKMTTHYPVLLILYKAFQDKKIKANELKECMQYIESFVIRRAFKSKVSRDLNQVFARIAGKLVDYKKSKKGLVSVFADLLATEGWPADEEFKACFVSSPIYSTAPAFARYSLIAIEKKNSSSHKEMQFDKPIQIEHVFPQQQKSEDWEAKDLPSLIKNLHVMGNLTLTGYNQSYSNKRFSDKLAGSSGYKNSPYWLTKNSIANKKHWTGNEIEQRSLLLLRQAIQLWPGR